MVTLALLVVSLLLGLASYQNSRQEEVMAGNQRAGALAMMAAEYGAAQFWHDVQDAMAAGDIESPGEPSADDDYDSYLTKILESFSDWASGTGYDPTSGSCVNVGGEVENACFRISLGSVLGSVVSVSSDGFVHEGAVLDGNSNGIPDNHIARRRIVMGWGALLGESLSPFNLAGNIVDYDGISSQAAVSGEEVDGYVNPAISVYGKSQAALIVQDIIGKNSSIDDNAVFIPRDSSVCSGSGSFHATCPSDAEGVYHPKEVVAGDPPEYLGNYEGCESSNSNFCNYKGGISSKLGAEILRKPEDFHLFVNALVQQQGDNPTDWTDVVDTDHGDGVTFVTTKSKPDPFPDKDEEHSSFVDYPTVYDAPVYGLDGNVSEDGRLTKATFDVAKNGAFSGSGVLVVDGDLEFQGNPSFDGLIIVLGDYMLNGGGNEDFTGAIISAPYSVRYEYQKDDGSWDYLRATDVGGEYEFVDESGNPVYFDGVTWTNDPGESGSPNPRLRKSDFYDGDGNRLILDGLAVNRRFDPLGLDVNGGGGQNHVYSYESIEKAFSYLDDQTLLALLVGQARPDGSYEYGLSTWEEQVNIPDEI